MLQCKTKSKGRWLGSRELTKVSTQSHSPARQLSENEAHPLSLQLLCKGKNKEGAQWWSQWTSTVIAHMDSLLQRTHISEPSRMSKLFTHSQ